MNFLGHFDVLVCTGSSEPAPLNHLLSLLVGGDYCGEDVDLGGEI